MPSSRAACTLCSEISPVMKASSPAAAAGASHFSAAPVHQPTFRMSCAPPATAFTLDEFASHLERRLARAPLAAAGGAQLIRKVGWCTGAAETWLAPAAAAGLDAFI